MKVFHIAGGGDRGGAKPHIFTLLKALGDRGELLCMRAGEFYDDAVSEGIPTRLFWSKIVPLDYVRLIKYVKKQRPDVVHCHGAKANIAGVLVRLFVRGVKTVTTVHSDWRLDYMHSLARRATLGIWNSLALRGFHGWITVSDSFKEMMIRRRYPPGRIMTIYNGVDFSVTAPPFDRAEYLRALGLDYEPGDTVLGILARLSPVKDIPTLLRAFAAALEKNPRLRLLIGGDGEDAQKLRRLAGELGLRGKAVFCGWIRDVHSFFGACDIDVLCSVSESFPYSVLEGVREGCAVITSDVGGMRKLITSGEDGYIFQPGDENALREHILELAADPEKRRLMAKRLLEKASRDYSLESMGRTQLEIYERLLRPDPGRRGRVVLCGAYGRGNTGDEAILRAIVDALRSLEPDVGITVMTRNPMATRVKHGVDAVYTFNFPAFLKAMRRAGLYINGGGSLIQDVTSSRSLKFYLYTLYAAHRRGARVLMYGCGIGRVHRGGNRKLTAKVLSSSVDVITLRDPASLHELMDMGVRGPEICLSADPVIRMSAAPPAETDELMRACGLDPDKKYVAFALRPWQGLDDLSPYAAAARYAREKYGYDAVFLPVEIPSDTGVSQRAAELAGPFASVAALPGEVDASLMIGLISRMELVVGMRLHSLIFAAAAGTPAVAASYDLKVSGFMDYLGMPGLCMDISSMTESWLCGAIDRALSSREELIKGAERLREAEKQNAARISELLKS